MSKCAVCGVEITGEHVQWPVSGPAHMDKAACVEALRAALAAAEEKLADERKHVAVLAAALEETRCTCEAVFVGGMPTALKCTRCRALTAHAARRKEEAR